MCTNLYNGIVRTTLECTDRYRQKVTCERHHVRPPTEAAYTVFCKMLFIVLLNKHFTTEFLRKYRSANGVLWVGRIVCFRA